MQIVVVGAGLGGLSAALCFALQGHHVLVLEQRPTFVPAGGGISIRPAASKLLHNWGLKADLEVYSDPSTSFLIRSVKSGQIITRNVLVDISDQVEWSTSREHVIKILYSKACAAGAKVLFGASVVDVQEDTNKATLTCHDGRNFTADLVLGADGVRSRIRSIILSDCSAPHEPIVSDITGYGTQRISRKLIEHRADAQKLLEYQDYSHVWHGENCFVVSRYSKTLGTWGGLFGIKGGNDMRGMWDEHGDVNYVRKFFANAGACEDLLAALKMTNSSDRWRFAELPNLTRWHSKGGRIVLLGDAAHAMHPNAAQGYSLTVEDIGVLEYLISQSSDGAAEVPNISKTWQRIRKARVERIKDYARENTAAFIGEPVPHRYAPKGDGSGILSLKNVVPNMNAKFTSPSFVKWSIDYDAVAEAKKYVQQSIKASL